MGQKGRHPSSSHTPEGVASLVNVELNILEKMPGIVAISPSLLHRALGLMSSHIVLQVHRPFQESRFNPVSGLLVWDRRESSVGKRIFSIALRTGFNRKHFIVTVE
jgi:hypothetical protein